MTVIDAPPNVTPTENLVRQRYDSGAVALRADDDTGRTMFGHFSVFDSFTEINSWYEGRFLERVRRGSFEETFAEDADSIRVLYDHGHDPSIGNKPLGAPDVMREDKNGAYYESDLFDSGYVNDLMPALRAKQLGASFRFKVTGEDWDEPSRSTKTNPEKLPERTITKVRLYEFGPVTFPAYGDATAGVRSGSDTFITELLADPELLHQYIDRVGTRAAAKFLASLPAVGGRDAPASIVPAVGGSDEAPVLAQARAIARARATLLTAR